LGGTLVHRAAEFENPSSMWYIISGIGVATACILWLYDRFLGSQTKNIKI
jgi:hypothetical protein